MNFPLRLTAAMFLGMGKHEDDPPAEELAMGMDDYKGKPMKPASSQHGREMAKLRVAYLQKEIQKVSSISPGTPDTVAELARLRKELEQAQLLFESFHNQMGAAN